MLNLHVSKTCFLGKNLYLRVEGPLKRGRERLPRPGDFCFSTPSPLTLAKQAGNVYYGMQSENDRGTEESLTADIAKIVKSVDFFILSKLVASNVEKAMDKVIRTHTKKFKQLTSNTVLPYSSNETVLK